MKIVVPMAGMGKRMRPHTLTVPKPLIPVGGQPIVHRLVEDLSKMVGQQITEVAYVVGHFGEEAEKDLIRIAESIGAKGSIYYQDQALGTAHAIHCAADSLEGPVVVAFADTLFYGNFSIDTEQDGVIWTKAIENPQAYGVVETNKEGIVTQLWEKPAHFVSDKAIIGVYYFRDGANLKSHLQNLIDNNIMVKGEYQLTDALSAMVKEGVKFTTASVTHWLDCGNKPATVDANKVILTLTGNNVAPDVSLIDSKIIPPCYIGTGVEINNSIVGPYVSIGPNTRVINSIVKNSIILHDAVIQDTVIHESMIGNYAQYLGRSKSPNLGDYSVGC